MLNSYLLALVLISFGSLCLFRLWENPPQWRTPRQTEGGIFHRQAAALWAAWLSVLEVLLLAYWDISMIYLRGVCYLCLHQYLPWWVANLKFVPSFIRRAAARACLRRDDLKTGGQP